MPIENEAKFLMRAPAQLHTRLRQAMGGMQITQCYVPGRALFSTTDASVRLIPDESDAAPSLTVDLSPEDHALALTIPGATDPGLPGEIRFRSQAQGTVFRHTVTFKMPTPSGILEIERPIPIEEVEAVRSPQQVRKTRYTLPVEGGQWDVDILHPRHVDAILMGLIEFEGNSLDAPVVHPLLVGQIGARIAPEDQELFTNRRLCDPVYATDVVENYLSGHLFREGLAKAVPGVTVFHARIDKGRATTLHEALCGEPDDVLIRAVHTTIAEAEYRAVGRFSTDSLDEALAMTTHGRIWPNDGWHNRDEPARYRFYSPLGRTKEMPSDCGSLFVHAGIGYVLTDDRRFVPVGPVDAEAVKAAYPWP